MKINNKVAKRFAKALFDSQGLEKTEKALHELDSFNAVLLADLTIASIFTNPAFTLEERTNAVSVIAKKLKTNEIVEKFIKNLTLKKYITGLTLIIETLRALYMEKAKKGKVTVITASALGKDKEEKLKNALHKRLNKMVEIEYVTDESILGGLVVKVGGFVLETSIKGQLRLLKEALLKE
ncbi:MAG: ATP synthase F1 subunit delta [Nitrospirae bacterium]|nr:ATP synthase F1 subunit delta [Nitrospirota bacterium]MBF0533688.1 ATP synthase F1 subunit delta [Nitrospirota bacterium]MBF0616661.1 ATP synthase F1 subunit delta [Nitrospirota bacterium]